MAVADNLPLFSKTSEIIHNLPEVNVDLSNPLALIDPKTGAIKYATSSNLLGQGSMNFVFAGIDVETGAEIVARIPKSIDSYQDEVALLANLDHPNLPKVYGLSTLRLIPFQEFDVSRSNASPHELNRKLNTETPVTIMEFVRGESLEKIVFDKDPEEWHQLVPEIITQLSDTVDYLAEHGIFHRDLNIKNIIYDGQRVVVLDFGVSNKTYKYSAENKTGGNPYNPPESVSNWDGMGLPSEVFSLAVMSYELLADGELPYGQVPIENEFGSSVYLKVPSVWFNYSLTETPYESISTKSERYSPQQAEKIDQVFKKALSLDPESRYQTATEFKDSLLEALR